MLFGAVTRPGLHVGGWTDLHSVGLGGTGSPL